jgi:7-cyano-7-deazaguanine synthase
LKTVALLSGGLDSVVNLKCAVDQGQVELALTFDYGQIAFGNERKAASVCAERVGIPHQIVGLSWYKGLAMNPVVGQGKIRSNRTVLAVDRAELLKEAWIPNRNCVFLSIAAAFAEALDADGVLIGLNRDEAEVFPDNSEVFMDRMTRVLELSTLSGVKIMSYTAGLRKKEIVELGVRIGAPLDLIYSCYCESEDQRMCGVCQSCLRLKSALRENDLYEKYRGRFMG